MNSDSEHHESSEVSYLGVAISNEGLAEMRGGRRIVFVPKELVRQIEVRLGSQAERPMLQGTLGCSLVLLGAAGTFAFAEGRLASPRWEVGFLFFAMLGLWLVWETIRRRYYLRVISSEDTRKLVFTGRVQRTELESFLQKAAQFGYSFQQRLGEKEFI